MQNAAGSLPDDANALKALLIAERVQNELAPGCGLTAQRPRLSREGDRSGAGSPDFRAMWSREGSSGQYPNRHPAYRLAATRTHSVQ